VRLNPGNSPLAESLGLSSQAEKSLLLRHPTQDSWVVGSIWSNGRAHAKYISDAFTASCLEELGHPAMKRRFVNVFLNGKYWGAYEAMEQLAPGLDATALLEPGDVSSAGKAQAIFGSASAWEQLCLGLREERRKARDGLVESAGWDACMKQINVENLIESVIEVRDQFIPQRHDVLKQDLEAYLSGARHRQTLWAEAAAARRHLMEQERLAEEEYLRQREAAGIAAKDRDGDGLPDDWETAQGFDPDNPEDAHTLIEGTNLTAFDLFVGVTPESSAEAVRSSVGRVYSPLSVRYLKGEWVPDPAFKSLFD
jgi:hypothetical protein